MGFTSLATAWTGGNKSAAGDEGYFTGQLKGNQILAPLIEPEEHTISDQLKVATTLAQSSSASLLAINPATSRGQTPDKHRREFKGSDEADLIRWAVNAIDTDAGAAQESVRYGRRLVKCVMQTITSHDIDTIVLPGGASRGILRRDETEQIATHADCDVVYVNGQPGYDDVASILLPIAGGPHSGLATDIAKRVAEDHGAWIDLLHIIECDSPESKRRAAEQYLTDARERLGAFEHCDTWTLEADDVTGAIIEQSEYYSLIVLGAPTKGRLRQFVFGSTTQDVRVDAQSMVLVARNNQDLGASFSE